MKQIIVALILCFFIGCSHGPQVTVCASAPAQSQFNCATSSGPSPSVTYAIAATAGYIVYASQGEQSVLDYCENRNSDGTEPPQFAKCSIDMASSGFDCISEFCEVNGFNNGLNCTPGASSFVGFSDSQNYLAFSPADNQTLLDYCNISIETQK